MKTARGALVLALLLAGLAVPQLLRPSTANAAVTHRVLITGDSITQGSSGDYTWRYRLWNKLAGTAPGDVSFVGTRDDLYDNVNSTYGSQHYAASFSAKSHAAKWGGSFTEELANISSQVSSTNPNVLVVMLGSNDLAYKTSPAQTVANLRTYIQRARAAAPGIDVVVGEVVDRYDPWAQSYWLTSETIDYAARIRTLAAELNTSSQRVVVAATRNGWDARDHTWDGTHPNPTGEKLIAQRVSEGLAAIGVGASSPNIIGTTAWNVSGPTPSLTAGSEQARLSWSRTSTGALSMFIEQRLTNTNEAWRRLPYAVDGDGWTADLLAAGGTYQFRIAPSKGWNTGTVGGAASVTPTGPVPGNISALTAVAGGASSMGGETANTSWSASTNASGYKLASRAMSSGSLPWDNLPYAITGREWTFEPLYAGRRYQFKITPVRGFLEGNWRASSVVRVHGIPSDRTYVALGDSYSSGLGSYGSYTDGECLRSSRGWVWQLQPSFMGSVAHLACAGATISGQGGQKSVVNQIPGMESKFASRPGTPQLVTLTVGGNDVGFSNVLKDCVTGPACTGREGEVSDKIAALEPKLAALYSQIKASAPYADILVGGYPDVLEEGGGSNNPLCLGVGDNERAMANRLARSLNNTIASAASSAGVWSVGQQVAYEFSGQNACTSGTEWIHAGVMGADAWGVDEKSFHPNDGGQYTYALVFSRVLIARAG